MAEQLERAEMRLLPKEKKAAKRKAKYYLETLSGNQKTSLNEAVRWCINNAPESTKTTK